MVQLAEIPICPTIQKQMICTELTNFTTRDPPTAPVLLADRVCDKAAKTTFHLPSDVSLVIVRLDVQKILMGRNQDMHPHLPCPDQSVSTAFFYHRKGKKKSRFSSCSTASPSKKQVKAIYDFSGENPNELNLCAGDVITVIEEIDQGWWKGELFDANGNRQQGLFPSNYVEEIAPPPMPIRPVSSRSQSTSHYSHSTENLEMTEEPEDSPFADSSRVSASYANQSPPKPMMARRGTAGSLHSAPTTSPTLPRMPSVSQINVRNNIGSSRTPPPPPTSRTPSRSFTTGSHTAPPTPMGRNTTSYFAPPPSNTNQHHPPCDECGCDDFSPDVFKPSRCKSCFHYHG